MINRASVPMWGKARESAGPAKWPGKERIAGDCRRSGGTDPILSTQRIPRGRDRDFIYTNFSRGRYTEYKIYSTEYI